MRKKVLLGALTISMLIAGCSKSDNADTSAAANSIVVKEETETTLKTGDLALYQAMSEKKEKFVFSPVIMKNSFWTIYENASGDTKEKIETVFEFQTDENGNNYGDYKEYLTT